MLHIVDISEDEYVSYIFNARRHLFCPDSMKICKSDYLVLRWNDNSILFFVNDISSDLIDNGYMLCALVPCHIEIDDVSFVSKIEKNDCPDYDDIYDFELPFS